MKEFLRAALRTATSIFLALLGIVLVIAIFSWGKDYYDQKQATPFEEVKEWKFDLKDALGLSVVARTKLISGNVLAKIDIDGYPQYLSDPRNATGSFNFIFLDKDGFKVYSKEVQLHEFTSVVGNQGAKSGLAGQFEEFLGLDNYKKISRMEVQWRLVTDAPREDVPKQTLLDHCAPNISKAERLKRLAQYGKVRETGLDTFTAGGHSIVLSYGMVISCD